MLAAVIVFGVGVRIFLSVKTDFSIGDAYIIFRFAEQFAAGNGLVFNAGESVGGNTSPLHTFLLGLGACSGVAVPWVARILGTMCDVAALFLMWGIFRWRGGIRSPWLQMAALAVVFLHPMLFFYSVSGMETPLYVALILFLLHRTLQGADWVWVLAVGLVFFCRPDGVVAASAALLFWLLTNKKIPWKGIAGAFVMGVVYLGFNYFAYDSVIPPTVKVKAVTYHNTVAALFQYIADRFFFHRAWLLGCYVLLLLVLTVARRDRPAVLLLGLTSFGYLLFDLTAPYLRSWYVVPFLTLSACTILLAAAAIAEDTKWRLLRPVAMASLAVYVLGCGIAYRVLFRDCRTWRERVHETTELAGNWLRDNTPPESTVFVTALETGYFAKRRTWDWPGLVAPQVLELIRADREMGLLAMADRLSVDYAVLPNQFHETNHPNFQLLKVFGTQKSAAGVGLADWSYSIYQRSNSTNPPVTK